MADYEDQNSSEYKDMNQETQAQIRIHTAPEMFRRIQIRHSRISRIHPRMTGRFRLRILDRIRTGRISRMADRFRLRIRDRIHTGRIHRTAGRFRLRILDRIHTGRISRTADSSHRRTGSRRIGRISTITGQPPYWQNQPQRPRREKNSFATISLISGIFALLTLCCFAFPVAIICGVGAVCFAIISKKRTALQGYRSGRNHPRRYRRSSRHRRVLLCTHHHKLNERPGKRRGIQRVL